MRLLINNKILGLVALITYQSAIAHGPQPMPLQYIPIPPVPGLLDGSDPIVVNKDKAIALGKALFWDINAGSDGMACGSCHFHAGADIRVKNQLNPGLKSSNPSGLTFQEMPAGNGGPNYTMTQADFPLFQFNDPLNKASGIAFSTDDVMASSGTFSGDFKIASKFAGSNDQCDRKVDPAFHVGVTGTRRVEPRHAPTVINTIFNYRNFWDGRANNVFNGSSPWGERDPKAGVWIKTGARTVVKQRLHLQNSSLASLSVGPPLSDTEMSCGGRNWPDIGRKLLLRQPLQSQKVHYQDSVLGGLSLSTPASLKPGLNTTYKNLIMQAFNSKYWSYAGTGPFGSRAGQSPYDQMEANFSMFFGLALQLYQGTLISDQAPIDLSPRDPSSLMPTWEGMGFSEAKITQINEGIAAFTNNHCNICHAGPALTTAAIAMNSALLDDSKGQSYGPEHSIPFGPDALGADNGAYASGISKHISVVNRDGTVGGSKLFDQGFANTGVINPLSDPGVGGVDDFGNPLSFSAQYVNYLLGNTSGVLDLVVKQVRTCDFLQAVALDVTSTFTRTFTRPDGLQRDGEREGQLREADCLDNSFVWIPNTLAANNAVVNAPGKLAVANTASFKIPTLRNIELTGPYMHNGSMATLEQVMEFYARKGNNNNNNRHSLVSNIALANAPEQREAIIEFLKTLTDDRVKYEKAPFDRPEIKIPNGHEGNESLVASGNPINAKLAKDSFMVLPAVGANGNISPIEPFVNYLQP
jgi:cytochrome c peroxidase